MKTAMKCGGIRAFTIMDLLGVVVMLLVLGFLTEAYSQRQRHLGRSRIKCVNNLKNVGLAFRVFATDNGDRFPQAVPVKDGGTLEYVDGGSAYLHFRALADQLSTPKILICPNDGRVESRDFTNLLNLNVSYFIGLDANETNPAAIIAGDRNITNGVAPTTNGLLNLVSSRVVGWTEKIHVNQGNVVMADGSVQQVSSSRLQLLVEANTNGPTRIVLPVEK